MNDLNTVSLVFYDALGCSIGLYSFMLLKSNINPLQPEVAFLYPLRTSGNLQVFSCFQGV